MGKRDRRSSMKMNRRSAQAKKKERAKKKRATKKVGAVAPVAIKKTRAPKGSSPGPGPAEPAG
jgi:hypothetical protein